MSEHYPKHFDEAEALCRTCGRATRHRVSAGRLAHCLEHEAPFETKKQLRDRARRAREQANPRFDFGKVA